MAPERSAKVGTTTALLVLAGAAVVAYGLDQLTKYLVVSNLTEGETVQVLGQVLEFQFVRNPGAAFSLASGMTWIFTILAAGVITFIIWFARRIKSVAWAMVFGLLLGGVLGNLTDRLFREPSFGLGHVIDFISTPWMLPAIYNVADISIVSSMALFMILTIRGIGLDGSREVRPTKQSEAGEAADAEAQTPAGSESAGGDAETGSRASTASPRPSES
ncbi:signal peptidase II [Agromyces mediolanus]|uniref:signal peptidase II n=1 Tax=Agromyces mediolanus TaxID=41986 RepID=UPI003832880C